MFNWLKKIFSQVEEKNANSIPEKKWEGNENVYKFKLNTYNEVVYIAKILRKKGKILTNLNELEKSERRRVLDFLSGVIYFKNGKVKKIKEHIYLFTIEDQTE